VGDVAVRRIAPDVDRIKLAMANGWSKLRGTEPLPSSDYMDKLRSRKAEVGEQLERSRFASRFEAPAVADREGQATAAAGEAMVGGQAAELPRVRPATAIPKGAGLAPDAPRAEDAGYTNRLLKAKQKVWEDREKEKEKRDQQEGR